MRGFFIVVGFPLRLPVFSMLMIGLLVKDMLYPWDVDAKTKYRYAFRFLVFGEWHTT